MLIPPPRPGAVVVEGDSARAMPAPPSQIPPYRKTLGTSKTEDSPPLDRVRPQGRSRNPVAWERRLLAAAFNADRGVSFSDTRSAELIRAEPRAAHDPTYLVQGQKVTVPWILPSAAL